MVRGITSMCSWKSHHQGSTGDEFNANSSSRRGNTLKAEIGSGRRGNAKETATDSVVADQPARGKHVFCDGRRIMRANCSVSGESNASTSRRRPASKPPDTSKETPGIGLPGSRTIGPDPTTCRARNHVR